MREIKGQYNTAKVFTDNIEEQCVQQVRDVCDMECFKDSKIRIMPDCHMGKGICIGFTQTLTDKVIPSFVGVDIGCGMLAVRFPKKDVPEIDFEKLDKCIRDCVPYGRDTHRRPHKKAEGINLKEIRCPSIDKFNAAKSIGSLGGGNHFIEVNEETDYFWIVIHTGSRHLGLEIEDYYSNKIHKMTDRKVNRELIEQLKADGSVKDIHAELNRIKAERNKEIQDSKYLTGEWFDDYIHDMGLVQKFAKLNRETIFNIISIGMRFPKPDDMYIDTVHNYIDTQNMIVRKGAISAEDKEMAVIPINMRDGSLIVIGKGNSDWNYSAPHGAGRILSRTQAEKVLKLEDFKETMKDVWSTSVDESTISEAPMAYKPIDEIIENIKGTVDVLSVIKPVYNFKAPEDEKFWKKKTESKA